MEEIERIRADDEQVKDAGCRHAAELCREVLRIATPSQPDRDDYCIIRDGGGIDVSKLTNDEDWYWGVDGLHFYTLNLERSVTRVLFELLGEDASGGKDALASNDSDGAASDAEGSEDGAGLGTKEEIKDTTRNTRTRALPWRPSALSSRARREQVRPINWANRPKSYVRRTEEWSWDEFPNGRWGDSASPAFGDLSTIGHFYGSSSFAGGAYDDGDDEHRTIMSLDGRDPSSPSDVFEVFARYVEGRVPHIPWSEGPLQSESLLIQEGLARLNRAGFLTINSQPAVDGAPSSHKVFGWGHPNGRVYQRAYCECFCSPSHLHRLRKMVLERPALSLYALPRPGPCSTGKVGTTAGLVVVWNGDQVMASEDGDGGGEYSVTALTWGVFPNREVVQPTIFDPVTFFGVWAEEAFSLWTTAWMRLYEPESDAYMLLGGMRDTYYLCAIVDNDYVTGNASSPSSRLWDDMLSS
jgi:methylenetetrahydrofolate reductase (NADPH)